MWGSLGASFSALLLPPDSDKVALAESDMWRLIYALPIAMYAIMMILMLVVVKYDSPKYSLVTGNKEDCISVIHQIYKTSGDREYAEEI